jgi:AcrR family transcriptional regulator
MQYKKKFINDKILESGRDEYLEKGFRGGNISTIANNAGVPVGNLYRYFDGKSGLLDAIVKPAYLEVPKIINRLAAMDLDKSVSLDEVMRQLTGGLLQLFGEYGKEILILVDRCATTRYEEFGDQLTTQISGLVLSKLYTNPTESDSLMAQLISKAFINSVLDVLRMNIAPSMMEEILLRILRFYFIEVDIRK